MAVGEVESSQFTQMVLATLGHLSEPGSDYMLGITLSKSKHAQLYLFHKGSKAKVKNNSVLIGPTKMTPLSTKLYDLKNTEGLQNFMNNMTSAFAFTCIAENMQSKVQQVPLQTFLRSSRKRSRIK